MNHILQTALCFCSVNTDIWSKVMGKTIKTRSKANLRNCNLHKVWSHLQYPLDTLGMLMLLVAALSLKELLQAKS